MTTIRKLCHRAGYPNTTSPAAHAIIAYAAAEAETNAREQMQPTQ